MNKLTGQKVTILLKGSGVRRIIDRRSAIPNLRVQIVVSVDQELDTYSYP
jgi:hypothetical protein